MAAVALAALTVAGCSETEPTVADPAPATTATTALSTTTATSEPEEDFGVAGLIAALEAEGVAAVDLHDTTGGIPFGLAQLACVYGQKIRVYEYGSVTERREVSETISPDGWSAVNGQYEWVAAPSFWVRGNSLVFILGADADTRDALSRVMGQRIAGSDEPVELRDPRIANDLLCEI